ncbi:hypothetical protein FHW64_006066 [Variovorax sp. Sphag1AA]|nr:hypothetical protein [Variovorax sp. Sphag1AA]
MGQRDCVNGVRVKRPPMGQRCVELRTVPDGGDRTEFEGCLVRHAADEAR